MDDKKISKNESMDADSSHNNSNNDSQNISLNNNNNNNRGVDIIINMIVERNPEDIVEGCSPFAR